MLAFRDEQTGLDEGDLRLPPVTFRSCRGGLATRLNVHGRTCGVFLDLGTGIT